MNFLLRTAQPVVTEVSVAQELHTDLHNTAKPATTLEGLIADDPFPKSSTSEDSNRDSNEDEVVSGGVEGPSAKNHIAIGDHLDVTEDEGWITIPCRDLPENWSDAPDISSFRSLDRYFIFPGEQLHILVCLAASKEDKEIITAFKVAAAMSRNGYLKQNATQESKIVGTESNSIAASEGKDGVDQGLVTEINEENWESLLATREKIDTETDVFATQSLLLAEDHKLRTEMLLEKFRNSHFFVRIAESDERLWFKKNVTDPSSTTSQIVGEKNSTHDTGSSAVIERGNFDPNASGGVARKIVRCCSLPNGDLVVLLKVNVGISIAKDPVLEVFQFEKYLTSNLASENHEKFDEANNGNPCEELLKWLLPLDRPLAPPVRSLSPPSLSSTVSIGSYTQKSSFPGTSGSQLFSFGHLRSHSMSSLPQITISSAPADPPSHSRPRFDLEDWDHFSSQKFVMNQDVGSEGLLSFRGVSLEPERFSVRCGLEGIYIPGRRWRRKLEIIQPLEIQSFTADCNTEDLVCVQIKNVCPAHAPDIVIFLDAINIVFEEAPKGGPPISLPIAGIEAGNDHRLPNLALRRGEQHSFILKPANSMSKDPNVNVERIPQSPHPKLGHSTSNLHMSSRSGEGKGASSNSDKYAVLVSCRCNYTESRLFFKHITSWHPRVTRDIVISVASEMLEQTLGMNGVSQLPVQVLTLQASNLTSEDLTLTVLAPASFTSPPSVVSLNSAPSTPMSPFTGFSDAVGRVTGERGNNSSQRFNTVLNSETQKESGDGKAKSVSFREQTVSTADFIANTGLGCTHLWLQSTVPLGCVPAQSTATVRLELLPLTDGIITLDTLQVAVKEKGKLRSNAQTTGL